MIEVESKKLLISINSTGEVESLVVNEVNYLPEECKVPIIRVSKENVVYNPKSCVYNDGILKFTFEDVDINLEVKVEEKDNYITLEVIKLEGEKISTIIWGPYATKIDKVIGEIIGVVRNEKHAIGIQALNMKTIAGWPYELKGQVFDDSNEKILASRSVDSMKYWDLTAAKTDFGSVLQCFCRDRRNEEVRRVWEIDQAEAPAVNGQDAIVIGSKIALFGCNVDDAIDVIGEIEVAEGLPHPLMDGQWAKKNRECMRSYLITDISENNVEEIANYALKAGFKMIYHGDPFESWGQFTLRKDHFPNGDDSMKECVERAEELGVGIGVHTLSSFTSPHDKYVSPVPHKNLAKVGSTVIKEDIDKTATKIKIDNPEYFNDKGYMATAVINEELIRYENIENINDQWYLVNCERGYLNTIATSHSMGDKIGKLWDHGYKVFFPNIELQEEYSKRLVDLFNYTGIRQISFDGLEGCLSTGCEEYGMSKLMDDCFRGWKNDVINDSSRLHHYIWHIHTRTNWGEPWGEEMREGQIGLRVMNQEFYARNLFPRMLGWFLVRSASRKYEASTLEDIEWALSKGAGFDGGNAICITNSTLRKLGNINILLDTIKIWEDARIKNRFTQEQRERLKQVKTEWHLEKTDDGRLLLSPLEISKVYKCDPNELQPGQKGGADWSITNSFERQPLRFRLRVLEGDGCVNNISFRLATGIIRFNVSLEEKQYLQYNGGETAQIFDRNFNLLKEVKVNNPGVCVESGSQAISLSCDFEGDDEKNEVHVKFFTYGEAEEVK